MFPSFEFSNSSAFILINSALKKYFFKDVGHERAILQPFSTEFTRNFTEIEISTIIMLEISEMLINNQLSRNFDVFSILNKIKMEK